jgi:hypothetical protein
MSDQQTGGDLSVKWSIDVDNARKNSTDDSGGTGGGKHHQHGVDEDGAPGDWFTISLKVPTDIGDVQKYLDKLKSNDTTWSIQPDPNYNDRVFFDLKIEGNTHDQIRISWANSNNVIRPPIPIGDNTNRAARSAPKLLARNAGARKTSAKKRKKSAPKKKAARKSKHR